MSTSTTNIKTEWSKGLGGLGAVYSTCIPTMKNYLEDTKHWTREEYDKRAYDHWISKNPGSTREPSESEWKAYTDKYYEDMVKRANEGPTVNAIYHFCREAFDQCEIDTNDVLATCPTSYSDSTKVFTTKNDKEAYDIYLISQDHKEKERLDHRISSDYLIKKYALHADFTQPIDEDLAEAITFLKSS
ncbi:uncharacterized protein L199_001233 [Kwoniella botswanensis]|uniref:uncharacterized protein n=1 Tax=Kwoniella botswanensis TaxID=1268659 RepID=UPI00315C9EB2